MQRSFLNLREKQVFRGRRAGLLYEIIGWIGRNATGVNFMNYGYAETGTAGAPALDTGPERHCAALYHVVASQADLGGRRVLDIGCGRGGGAAYVHRHLGPAQTVGCDRAASAIAFCRRMRGGAPGLSFHRADALALPFADGSFDAVLNVESAHCYPDAGRFMTEVFRVLAPGGSFLYADFTAPRRAPEAECQRTLGALGAAGFDAAGARDITASVVAGLDRDHDRRCADIRALFPPGTRRFARLWAGTRDSWIYRDFAEGRRGYFLYCATKPLTAATPARAASPSSSAPRPSFEPIPALI